MKRLIVRLFAGLLTSVALAGTGVPADDVPPDVGLDLPFLAIDDVGRESAARSIRGELDDSEELTLGHAAPHKKGA